MAATRAPPIPFNSLATYVVAQDGLGIVYNVQNAIWYLASDTTQSPVIAPSNWFVKASTGGSAAGPANTPGYGAAVVNDPAPATTLTSYLPSGYSSSTSEVRLNATAATTLNSIDATGRTNGSTLHIVNSGTATISIPNSAAGSAPFLTAGAATMSLPANASAFAIYDATSAAWRFA